MKCPRCGSENIHLATTVPNALCVCFECRHQWKAHYKPRKPKKAILKAFKNQVEGKGFSLIEIVSTCPTNWGMTPSKALEWVDTNMIPYYPLGVYKDKSKED